MKQIKIESPDTRTPNERKCSKSYGKKNRKDSKRQNLFG